VTFLEDNWTRNQ